MDRANKRERMTNNGKLMYQSRFVCFEKYPSKSAPVKKTTILKINR
jgi:hypothetical protein